jgi:hypothetical protein
MGNPEPSPNVLKSIMDAVQRVDVGRLELIEGSSLRCTLVL